MLGALKKKVEKIFSPSWHNEGVGAKVLRIIGVRELPRLDPFLMLDYFFVKLPAGFPDHPHRGFETVTYMKKGKFYHEDFKGHAGIIGPGDIQWMTAGKGIVHSEMPGSFDEESQGFQLWLNLEKKNKLCDPQYQEWSKDKIPTVEKDGNSVTVIAGEAFDTKGPIIARTPAFYLDVTMKPKSSFSQIIPKRWNSMCFVYSGSGLFADPETKVTKNQAVVLKLDDNELLEVKSQDEELKFIIFAGLPLNEPIAQHGPFVMNEQHELQAAIRDYSSSRNGFENAQIWESKIQNFVDPKFYEKYTAEHK